MYFIQTNSRAYIDYIPARLAGSAESYIIYYVKDPVTQKLRRIRNRINKIPAKIRVREARKIISDINTKLALGWNPLVEVSSPRSYETIGDVFDSFLAIKLKEMEGNSVRSYLSYVKIFRKWLSAHGISESSYVCSLDRRVAMAFMDGIDRDAKKCARTYNNYLSFFRGMFNWVKDKGYIAENPFAGIAKKPKRLTGKVRRKLSKEELSKVSAYLRENNPHYLLAVLMCYGCFVRPKELAMLKCRDVDLERQVVHIRPEIAKNDKDSYRTIPDGLIPALRNADLTHPDWYLFAKHAKYDFRPGPVKVCSRKLAKYWSDHVRDDCGLPMEVQFYSLKDTGITEMLHNGVPINTVQKQADHSSIAMTAIYVGQSGEADEELKSADIFRFETA